MTNNTCVCGRPFHRHDTLNVVVDALSNGCKKFTPTPTQIKASEPAEAEECEHVFGGLRGDDWGNPRSFCKLCDRIYDPAKPAASQQAPADLVSEAKGILEKRSFQDDAKFMAFSMNKQKYGQLVPNDLMEQAEEFLQKDSPGTNWKDSYEALRMAAFAQHKLQQATSPDAVIDEFIDAMELEVFSYFDQYGLRGTLERKVRSVAEEMKRK